MCPSSSGKGLENDDKFENFALKNDLNWKKSGKLPLILKGNFFKTEDIFGSPADWIPQNFLESQPQAADSYLKMKKHL